MLILAGQPGTRYWTNVQQRHYRACCISRSGPKATMRTGLKLGDADGLHPVHSRARSRASAR